MREIPNVYPGKLLKPTLPNLSTRNLYPELENSTSHGRFFLGPWNGDAVRQSVDMQSGEVLAMPVIASQRHGSE